MNSFIIICGILAAVFGQIKSGAIKHHPCPDVSPMENLIFAKISGRLYGCFQSNEFLDSSDCTTLDINTTGPNECNTTYSTMSKKTGNREVLTATSTIDKNHNITVIHKGMYSAIPPVYLTIVDTNYDDYVIYWGCQENNEMPWLSMLTKDHTLCSAFEPKVKAVIEKYNLNITLTTVNHDNCTY